MSRQANCSRNMVNLQIQRRYMSETKVGASPSALQCKVAKEQDLAFHGLFDELDLVWFEGLCRGRHP